MSRSNLPTFFHHGHDGDGEGEPHGVVDADGQEGHEHEQMPLAKTCCGRENDCFQCQISSWGGLAE